jgi:hypothetical protein
MKADRGAPQLRITDRIKAREPWFVYTRRSSADVFRVGPTVDEVAKWICNSKSPSHKYIGLRGGPGYKACVEPHGRPLFVLEARRVLVRSRMVRQ